MLRLPGAGALAGVAVMLAAPARADVILKDIRWHLPRVAAAGAPKPSKKERLLRAGRAVYAEAGSWVHPPGPRLQLKPRAVITLANRGPRPAEGVLLLYAVSARLSKVAEPGREGVWSVPFWTEERRVTRMKPNQTRDIPIDNMGLAVFLRKMFQAGLWPDAVKIQVMVEPKNGEGLEQRVLERTLPVAWQP